MKSIRVVGFTAVLFSRIPIARDTCGAAREAFRAIEMTTQIAVTARYSCGLSDTSTMHPFAAQSARCQHLYHARPRLALLEGSETVDWRCAMTGQSHYVDTIPYFYAVFSIFGTSSLQHRQLPMFFSGFPESS
jgi:hypothetical protein